MPVNNNDNRVKRTKKLIRKGLAELSQSKSITKITVKELTDLIEINRGTFYLHYKDIGDLVESLEQELYAEFEKNIVRIDAKNVLLSPIAILEDFCTFVHDNAEEFAMLSGVHGDAEFVHKIGTLLNDKVYALFLEIYPQMDIERYNMSYEYGKFGALGLLNCWLTKNPNWTAHQVAKMWFALLTNGLSGILDNKVKEYLN